MTVDQILQITSDVIGTMNKAEIKAITQVMASAMNKRIKRVENSGIYSPAVDAVMKSGGKFSTAGKTRNQLISELTRARNFANAKTSTVKGAKKVRSEEKERLGGREFSENERVALYEAFRKLKEMNPAFVTMYGSDRVLREMALIRETTGASWDDIINNLEYLISAKYEEWQGWANDLYDDENGFSNPFGV